MRRESWREEQGQAVLEMALVLPILVLLLLGIVEMGRIGYAFITVNNAARAGARVASVGGTDAEITAAVQGAAPSLNTDSLAITISPVQASRESGQTVTVDIKSPVSLIMPIPETIISNPVIVEAQVSMRAE